MIYTQAINEALKICFSAHIDQKDRSGVPYVFHPYHLAEQMPDDEDAIITALLHDVIEDTQLTISDIASHGFSATVIEALTLLTRDESDKSDEAYFEYVHKIASNPTARLVKIADLKHNSDITRLKNASEKDLARCEKYKKALAILI